MNEPWFWRDPGFSARAASAALTPAALCYDFGQLLRAAVTRPKSVGAPVICIGNATLGGVGKTPFAMMLQKLLHDRGISAHFLSRGFGGALKGPLRVRPQHTARDVGDEPILLAEAAPTWVAKDRASGAAAAAQGASVIIMDDGFQNPTVRKDFAILLVNAADPSGNDRIFPAGPLREPMSRAIARSNAIVLIGDGDPHIGARSRPIFRARRQIELAISPQKAVAFCGIGDPGRFYADLEANDFTLTARFAFPDHHFFSDAELSRLRKIAEKEGAALITTEKDYVRLSPAARLGIEVAKLKVIVDNADMLLRQITSSVSRAT